VSDARDVRELREVSCLNCGAPMAGAYCAACGQRAVDLAEPSWRVVKEAVSDAVDVDGRVVSTARALLRPGRLTVEHWRGRRAPYVGPLKLFLASGAVLSTTWIVTRGVDARFYGMAPYGNAASYIETVTRGLLGGALGVALGAWVLTARRRRLVDEAVFALHLVSALALLAAAVIWLATAWKVAWATARAVPAGVPSLLGLLFVPGLAAGVAYAALAVRRAHGGPWWAVALRTIALVALGAAVVTGAILIAGRRG
jgi:hypothetical protein